MQQQLLNRAMREIVEHVHGEGWDQPPSLFCLVSSEAVPAEYRDDSPLTAVQFALPEELEAGSLELLDYIARFTEWEPEVAGLVLAQEIIFTDVADNQQKPARLTSGVLRGVDSEHELVLLQLRPAADDPDPFADSKVPLLGAPEVGPQVLTALRTALGDA